MTRASLVISLFAVPDWGLAEIFEPEKSSPDKSFR